MGDTLDDLDFSDMNGQYTGNPMDRLMDKLKARGVQPVVGDLCDVCKRPKGLGQNCPNNCDHNQPGLPGF
jgi:hypothetical protein